MEAQLVLIQRQGEVNNAAMLSLVHAQQSIRDEYTAVRRSLRELKHADPKVKDFLSTPVPDSLRGLYQNSVRTDSAP